MGMEYEKIHASPNDCVEEMSSKIILMMPKNQESSKFQRIKSQASFKNQDQDLRFKNNQDQDSSKASRLKIQESREDSIKISIKRIFSKHWIVEEFFKKKNLLPKSFTLR